MKCLTGDQLKYCCVSVTGRAQSDCQPCSREGCDTKGWRPHVRFVSCWCCRAVVLLPGWSPCQWGLRLMCPREWWDSWSAAAHLLLHEHFMKPLREETLHWKHGSSDTKLLSYFSSCWISVYVYTCMYVCILFSFSATSMLPLCTTQFIKFNLNRRQSPQVWHFKHNIELCWKLGAEGRKKTQWWATQDCLNGYCWPTHLVQVRGNLKICIHFQSI